MNVSPCTSFCKSLAGHSLRFRKEDPKREGRTHATRKIGWTANHMRSNVVLVPNGLRRDFCARCDRDESVRDRFFVIDWSRVNECVRVVPRMKVGPRPKPFTWKPLLGSNFSISSPTPGVQALEAITICKAVRTHGAWETQSKTTISMIDRSWIGVSLFPAPAKVLLQHWSHLCSNKRM